jgi:hypothetical protein
MRSVKFFTDQIVENSLWSQAFSFSKSPPNFESLLMSYIYIESLGH